MVRLSAKEANRHYFREAYRTGVHGWGEEEPSAFAVRFLDRLKRLVPGGTLLDVGCGEGRHAFAADERGFQVTAIDYEALALQRARRVARIKQVKKIVFRKADVFDLPFPGASFDIILDYGCLHHQKKTDWPAYKASLLRVLKPQGFYVLSVFSPRFRYFHGSRRPWHIALGAYRRYFRREEIAKLFGRDFRIMELTEERGKNGGFWHVLMKRVADGELTGGRTQVLRPPTAKPPRR
jgi:ubiquinone/menaquinone biosynthesis C-methylase UbiE